MKQATVKLPMKQAAHFAKWCFEKNVKILLSYTMSDGFLGENIMVECAVPDEVLETFKTEFKNYIKE